MPSKVRNKKNPEQALHDLIAEQNPLRDADWRKIRESSNLPDAARAEITSAIVRFKHDFENQKDIKTVRERLSGCRDKGKKLSAALLSISTNSEFYYGTFESSELHPRELSTFVRRLRATLSEMDTIFARAEIRLSGSPGYAPYGPTDELITNLDAIRFRHLGELLTQSKKKDKSFSYVAAVLRQIHPTIADATILNHLKVTVRKRNRFFTSVVRR